MNAQFYALRTPAEIADDERMERDERLHDLGECEPGECSICIQSKVTEETAIGG